MADGDETLASIIDRLRGLPVALVKDAAPLVAKEAKQIISDNITAQRGPDGEAWARGEVGAGDVLTNAAKAVDCRAVGDTILITLEGPEVKHHKATAKGGIRRRIIPTKKIPAPLVAAIRKVLGSSFRKVMA